MLIYLEAEGVLKEVSDEMTVLVHLLPIPTIVGDHDSGNTFLDRVQVCWHVNAHETRHINDGVVLINASMCTTIPNKVLSTSSNIVLPSNIRIALWKVRVSFSLQPWNDFCHRLHNLGILTVALITPTPSWISTNLLTRNPICNDT